MAPPHSPLIPPPDQSPLDTDLMPSSSRKSQRLAHASATPNNLHEPFASLPNHMQDPSPFYIEEMAHIYHNPPMPSHNRHGILPKDLLPIPPPARLPSNLPETGHCKWSWDAPSRVLHADFSLSKKLDLLDEKFMLQMMERDDVTVISTGLLSPPGLPPDMWSTAYIADVLDTEVIHKIRRFDLLTVDGQVVCKEVDGMMSMKAKDYHGYIVHRHDYLLGDATDPQFTFFEPTKKTLVPFHVGNTILYIIDFDVAKLLPSMQSNFETHFRVPGLLPGGSHCMMSSVSVESLLPFQPCSPPHCELDFSTS